MAWHSTTMELWEVWEFPSPPIGDPDCCDVIIGKPYIVGARPTGIPWFDCHISTGDPLHSRAACTQPCNVNTHSRAHCSPGARLCEQWGHGCVNNGARLCASARLCRGSPVISFYWLKRHTLDNFLDMQDNVCIATCILRKAALTWSWWCRF